MTTKAEMQEAINDALGGAVDIAAAARLGVPVETLLPALESRVIQRLRGLGQYEGRF